MALASGTAARDFRVKLRRSLWTQPIFGLHNGATKMLQDGFRCSTMAEAMRRRG